jgi:hypothetical protein
MGLVEWKRRFVSETLRFQWGKWVMHGMSGNGLQVVKFPEPDLNEAALRRTLARGVESAFEAMS